MRMIDPRITTRAFWITGPGRAEIRNEVLRPPGAGEVQVRALFTGVSRGTEQLVYGGHVPASEYARMRAPFQSGDFPAPVKYGYASVGEVLAGPEALIGRHVFCLYPHQERYVVPSDALYPLPASIPAARAVLAANLETALNGIWDAALAPGDRVSIIGAGSVGCLVAWLARQVVGCQVQLVDVNLSRAGIAQSLGVAFATPDRAGNDQDVVIHSSGTSEGLALALRIAGFEATIVELSWYGDRAVTLPLGEAFHAQRLSIRSSQVGRVAATRRSRWTSRRRLELAISLLADPALEVLINSEDDFDALPDTFSLLQNPSSDVIMHRVRYRRDD